MSSVNNVGSNYNLQQLTNSQPPKESGWSKFGKVMGGVASSLPMVGNVMGALGVGGGGFSAAGISTGANQQLELIKLQQEIQQQTQMFTTLSNVSKSKHESAMSAIRNMK